jgi:hypothetical protein
VAVHPRGLGHEPAGVEHHPQGRDLAVFDVEPVRDGHGRGHGGVQVVSCQHVGSVHEDLLDGNLGRDPRHALDPLHVVLGTLQAGEGARERDVIGQHDHMVSKSLAFQASK